MTATAPSDFPMKPNAVVIGTAAGTFCAEYVYDGRNSGRLVYQRRSKEFIEK